MDLLLQLLSLLALAVCTCLLFLKSSSTKAARLPPGPYPFPVIGNLLQLGKLPHRSLAKLSQTYGPLMSLRLGSIYTVVVSSSDLAQQILTRHDLAFSNRIIPEAARVHDCHKVFTGFLPIGPQWRKTRKLSKEKLFTTASLAAGEELRRKEVNKLHDYVQQCCRDRRAVNIGEAVYTTTLNLISAALFSTELAEFESNDSHEFKNIANGIVGVLGEPNLADYFPLLQKFDPQGIRKRSGILFQKMLTFIEGLIHQRLQSKEISPDSPKKNDFLEALLDLSQDGEYNYTVNDISRLLTEFVAAGTHTTAATSEWALTELLLNPDKLLKVKQELKTVIGENNQIQESDFSLLPYFQAVIKEVFRCHIPGPFFVPRKSEQVVEINGYIIPKGTQLLINAWAIAKDPTRWSNPDSFEPERFLENKIGFKGQDFDLLPFSAGRRICPGMPLADRMLHMIVATLVHDFDWKLESNFKAEEATAEIFGLAVHKAVPLVATPIKL